MPAEVLLPSFCGPSGNIGAAKTGKIKSATSGRGFGNTLKAAHQAIEKSAQESGSPRKHQLKDYLDGSSPLVTDSQGAGFGDEILPEAMPTDDVPVEKIAVAEMPIVETGLLLIAASQPQMLTGVSLNPAFQGMQPGLHLGLATEKSSEDMKATLNMGNNALVIKEENRENAQILKNLSYGDNQGLSKNPNFGDNQGLSKNPNYGDSQELSKNQTVLKPNAAQLATTKEGSEQFGWGEKRPVAESANDASQSQKVWKSGASQPSQLIATESERLRGVTTQGFTNSDGMETAQGLLKPTGTEPPVLADKTALLDKVVSTEDIVEQIVKNMELVSNRKSSTVTIKLQPEFLGKLEINVEVKGNAVVARFSTDNQQVKQLLETGIGQLRTHLEISGIRLEKAEVNIDLGHHSGEFQHFNQSGEQNRQSTPYENSHYYLGQFLSDSGPSEIGESDVLSGQYSDGSINYLI